MPRDVERFVGDVRQDGRRLRRRKGTVTAVSGGQVTVTLSGESVTAPYLTPWVPRVGQRAALLIDDDGAPLAIGGHADGIPPFVAGQTTATGDASGYITFTHGLGAIPTAVLVQGISPISGGTLADRPIVDSYATTTARVRWIGTASASITFAWAAFR